MKIRKLNKRHQFPLSLSCAFLIAMHVMQIIQMRDAPQKDFDSFECQNVPHPASALVTQHKQSAMRSNESKRLFLFLRDLIVGV
jgi:hypothetical protein